MLNPEFTEMLRLTDATVFDGLPEALTATAPETSVRLNHGKAPGADIASLCGAPDIADGTVPWSSGSGFYLCRRPNFTLLPALHQGLLYVQDASSMCLSHIIAALAAQLGGGALRLLDACAAPGGKTLCAADALPAGSLVVANEYDFRRAEILRENVIKWGLPSAVVSRGDTARFRRLPEAFDIVCVDAPCSGEGMMRKDAEAAAQWSPALVEECARTQWRIVEALWEALRPGGAFVYSTCTFNRTENEEIVARLAAGKGARGVTVEALERPEIVRGIDIDLPCYRFLPGRVRGEGLFLCVLRKPGDASAAAVKTPRASRKPDAAAAAVGAWLEGDYAVATDAAGAVCAVPRAVSALLPEARGVQVAQIKGRDILPAQPLALSTSLRDGAFPAVAVDYATALAYLRREAVTLEGAPRGIVLLQYAGRPLGFVKNLGNRANNLYPQAWRIMSTHAPAAPPCVVQ